MQSRDHQLDDALKARRRQAEPGPRGEGSKRLAWASALGNAAVQRLLRSVALGRYSGGETVDDSLARAIKAKRGSGKRLDAGVRREMETSLGHDFSDVSVHTDAEADALAQAVQAEAFTTGRDVFFREGKYEPGSSGGRKLLAHELTHVVQQASATPAQELRVSSPDDASERQAGAVADRASASAAMGPVGRQAEEEEEEKEEVETSLERQLPDFGGMLGGLMGGGSAGGMGSTLGGMLGGLSSGMGGMPSLGGMLGGAAGGLGGMSSLTDVLGGLSSGMGGMPSLGGMLGGLSGGMGGMPSLGGMLGGAAGGMEGMPSLGGLLGSAGGLGGGLSSLGGMLGGAAGGMGGMPSLGGMLGGLTGGMGGMPSLSDVFGGLSSGMGGMPSLSDLFGGLTGGLMRAAPEEEEQVAASLEREAIERIEEEERVML